MGRWLLRAAALALLCAGPGCSADEESIEGKKCEIGSDDPLKKCGPGYKCVARPEGMLCEKVASSAAGLRDAPARPVAVELDAPSPSLRFLRHHGMVELHP